MDIGLSNLSTFFTLVTYCAFYVTHRWNGFFYNFDLILQMDTQRLTQTTNSLHTLRQIDQHANINKF